MPVGTAHLRACASQVNITSAPHASICAYPCACRGRRGPRGQPEGGGPRRHAASLVPATHSDGGESLNARRDLGVHRRHRLGCHQLLARYRVVGRSMQTERARRVLQAGQVHGTKPNCTGLVWGTYSSESQGLRGIPGRLMRHGCSAAWRRQRPVRRRRPMRPDPRLRCGAVADPGLIE